MAAPLGVSFAFDDATLTADPTWTRVDTGNWNVETWSIDRGRSDELSQTGTGTAKVTLHDDNGDWDPTNSGGTFYARLRPRTQAAIALWNPVDAEWNTLFRGYVTDVTVTPDVTERFTSVTIEMADAFSLFAKTLLRAGTAGGYNSVPGAAPPGAEGQVYYQAQNVDDRIKAVLTDAHWNFGTLGEIFSGNIAMQETVYAPDTQALAALQDAADAEFPGVGNFFVNRQGTATFHGRFARFNPANALYKIAQWKVGDVGAFAADSTTAVVSALSFNQSEDNVINSALATPQGVGGTSVAGLLRSDASSIGTFGFCTWSAENLLIAGTAGSFSGDAVSVCGTYAQYYVDNYKRPQIRIQELSMRTPPPAHPTSTRVWRTMSKVDISDLFYVTTSHVGGGGFAAAGYFVEGVHYVANAHATSYLNVTATFDLSPQANYGTATFGTA